VVLRAGFEKAGLKVPYAEYILPDSAPISDPSPIVNDIMTADGGHPPDAVYLVADFSNTNTMVQALKAASFPGKIIDAVGYDPRLASLASFDDTYVQLLWAPTESRDVPFVQQMAADLQKYEPDVPLSLPTIAGYISADFLVTALQKAGRDLTLSGFLSMMNTTGYTYHQAGFIADTHWPLNHSIGTPCSDLVHLKAQTYASVSGLQCTNLVPN
jgi:ABC-type branched-subunit amino acid transport system substrate-binding protein